MLTTHLQSIRAGELKSEATETDNFEPMSHTGGSHSELG